jgi:hypothetical protein
MPLYLLYAITPLFMLTRLGFYSRMETRALSHFMTAKFRKPQITLVISDQLGSKYLTYFGGSWCGRHALYFAEQFNFSFV